MTDAAPRNVQIVAADAVSAESVWRTFVEGFRAYVRPFEIGFEQFMGMMRSEDVDLGASVVAFDEADAPAAVALLAIRGDICWCGGLGVSPRLRRRGLGRLLMERLIAGARERGLSRMLLECIDGNDAARALYDGLGYRPVRRLDVFEGVPATPTRPSRFDVPVGALADPESVWAAFEDYHPAPPSWQGGVSGRRADAASGPIRGLRLGAPARPAAYVLARIRDGATAPIYLSDAGAMPEAGDPVANLGELVARLVAEYPDQPVVAPNIPENAPLGAVLRAFGVPVTLTQTEMELVL